MFGIEATRNRPGRRAALALLVFAWATSTGACIGTRAPSPATLARDAAAPTDNPFSGAKMWVDPNAVAVGLARRWRNDRPEDAEAIERIARQPTALWVGDWIADVETWVNRTVRKLSRGGYLPVLVAYNIPNRDCGQYSRGGQKDAAAYRAWITAFARGIGDRKAVVILEPDALAHGTECLRPEVIAERQQLIAEAVGILAAGGQTYVYLDAGHSDWVPAEDMAARLQRAGIARATGFALNVSNYKATSDLVAYGKAVSSKTGGKPFVLDTSRNGKGPPEAGGEGSWCNPHGRALGAAPTAETGDPLVHAFLWVKRPGESDGTCNGGPKAGDFWPDMALELARNAGES